MAERTGCYKLLVFCMKDPELREVLSASKIISALNAQLTCLMAEASVHLQPKVLWRQLKN